jgi:cytochrome c oxidase subunit 2
MGLRSLTGEHLARFVLVLVVLLIPLGSAVAWGLAKGSDSPTTIHGRVSEDGGWVPGTIRAAAGVPLRLRLTSDDVVHGFAIGKSDSPAIDLPPGKVVDTTLTLSEPGTYTFYCTRWCGPNHWRMRGVIEVTRQRRHPALELCGRWVSYRRAHRAAVLAYSSAARARR